MNEHLPDSLSLYINPLPENLSIGSISETVERFRSRYGDQYVKSIIWTAEDARLVLEEVGVIKEYALFYFYQNSFELPEVYRAVELYGLSQIRDDYRKPFWGDRFKGIQEQFLLISTTEGEYSYFYDKKSDSVFGVGWDQMDEFITGQIYPLFKSSFDFLKWYFSEEASI